MYEKLIFQAYASHNLDEVAMSFRKKFIREAEVFMIQPGYIVSGSKENHHKILESRFTGFASIQVPLYLSRMELENIYANFSEYRPRWTKEEKVADPSISGAWEDDNIRHCTFCGQIFEVDEKSKRIICNKPACIERFLARNQAMDEIKTQYSSNGNNNKPKEKKEPEIQTPKVIDDNFSLNDPYSNVIDGWVYLIESDNGLYKIGRSDDVWHRFTALIADNAANLTLRHTIYTIDTQRSETWMHIQFASKRHHGEWFMLSPEDIEWFCAIRDWGLDAIPAG